MFYLMTHSTHFIYGYMASDIWLRTILIERERNVLFNNALNTFYLRLYGVGARVRYTTKQFLTKQTLTYVYGYKTVFNQTDTDLCLRVQNSF